MSHYLFIKDLPVSLQKPNDLPVPSWHISLSQWQMAPRGHQASHVPPRRGENHGDRDDQGAIWWWLTGWWDVSPISFEISVGIRWITWQRWQRTNKEVDLRLPYFPVAMGSMQNPGEHGSIPRWKRREPKHLYNSTCNVGNKWKPMKHLKMANWKKLYQTLPDFKTTKELPVCRETDSALWHQPKIWWYAKVLWWHQALFCWWFPHVSCKHQNCFASLILGSTLSVLVLVSFARPLSCTRVGKNLGWCLPVKFFLPIFRTRSFPNRKPT